MLLLNHMLGKSAVVRKDSCALAEAESVDGTVMLVAAFNHMNFCWTLQRQANEAYSQLKVA